MTTPAPSSTSLAPGFLVAAPALADPNFAGSLVLMVRHTAEGALGFVANRPGPIAVGDVLKEVDERLWKAGLAWGRTGEPVLLGGPVRAERLWILCDAQASRAEEDPIEVGDSLAVGGSRDLLEAVIRDPARGRFQLILGCAGWGPLQVENEVSRGAWIPLPFHEDLLFDVPVASRWEEAVRRLGLEPGGFTVGGGGAQA
jgi:putative transcriptional regulator